MSQNTEKKILTLQCVCGKAKLELNQKEINNAQNQTPLSDSVFRQKETESWYRAGQHKFAQARNQHFLFINHFNK